MVRDNYLRIGDFLLEEGIITANQLEQAVTIQRQEGGIRKTGTRFR